MKLKKKEHIYILLLFFVWQTDAISPQIKAVFDTALHCLDDGDVEKSKSLFEFVYNQTGAISALYNAAYVKKIMAGQNLALLDEAIANLEWIVRTHPEYNDAQLALGFAYLEKGDYQKGWEQHAHYLKRSGKYAPELRELLAHQALNSKIILLHYEGGLGDSIHFVRYAQQLKKRGATVFVRVQEPLKILFSRCPYIDKVFSGTDPVPLCHASATLMSMPAVWWGQPDAIPVDIPYLYPDQALVEKWKKVCDKKSCLKIGVCWQSDVYNDSSRNHIARRGIPLKMLLQLASADLPVHFYSLQKKDGSDQVEGIPSDILTVFPQDFDESSGPFMDTAALMMSLDLIITIDSAIAHLAGALGRPVWLLLPYASDWRWVKGENTSIWYPSMKIFQQPHPFDWQSVIEKVQQDLKIF